MLEVDRRVLSVFLLVSFGFHFFLSFVISLLNSFVSLNPLGRLPLS